MFAVCAVDGWSGQIRTVEMHVYQTCVLTDFTTLQLRKSRSKWPDHYDSLLYQLSYVLTFLERTAGLKPATHGLGCKMNIAVWIFKMFRNAHVRPHDGCTRQVPRLC